LGFAPTRQATDVCRQRIGRRRELHA